MSGMTKWPCEHYRGLVSRITKLIILWTTNKALNKVANYLPT